MKTNLGGLVCRLKLPAKLGHIGLKPTLIRHISSEIEKNFNHLFTTYQLPVYYL